MELDSRGSVVGISSIPKTAARVSTTEIFRVEISTEVVDGVDSSGDEYIVPSRYRRIGIDSGGVIGRR